MKSVLLFCIYGLLLVSSITYLILANDVYAKHTVYNSSESYYSYITPTKHVLDGDVPYFIQLDDSPTPNYNRHQYNRFGRRYNFSSSRYNILSGEE